MTNELDQPEISFKTIWYPLVRHRQLVSIGAVVGAVILVAVKMFAGPEYTSTTVFFPQMRENNTSLNGLAAQFGLAMPTAAGSQSPQFYADLVESPTILREVVLTVYNVGSGSRKTLVDVYQPAGRTPDQRIDRAMTKLQKHITARVSPKTGVITIDVTASAPRLAAQIAQVLVDRINDLNLQIRRDQAAADREFAEQRLSEAAGKLREAEDRLQNFMQTNHDYQTSPRLQFEQDRLSRQIAMNQQMFSSLSDTYNQARLEAMRDSPVITMIDPPQIPVMADSRGLLKRAVAGIFLGGVVMLLFGIVRDVPRRRAYV